MKSLIPRIAITLLCISSVYTQELHTVYAGSMYFQPANLTISLGQNLTNIESISSATSNANLTLASNGTGDVVINDTLTFSGAASTPTPGSVTKIYNKTAGGGGTGLYFINSGISSGTEGELISKKKATALAIALG